MITQHSTGKYKIIFNKIIVRMYMKIIFDFLHFEFKTNKKEEEEEEEETLVAMESAWHVYSFWGQLTSHLGNSTWWVRAYGNTEMGPNLPCTPFPGLSDNNHKVFVTSVIYIFDFKVT